MTLDVSRRFALALGLGVAAVPLLRPHGVGAAPLAYRIDPKPIGDGVWLISGAYEPINAANGGAIANITIFDTRDGAVIVDAGPSHTYGEAL